MARKKKDAVKELWVAVCLDKSGSMASMENEVITGLNDFFKDRKADCKIRPVRVWVNTFNSRSEPLFEGVSALDLPDFTKELYKPSGWTALYDSVGQTINSMTKYLESATTKPDVTILVITDGQENSSKEFTQSDVKKLVSDSEKNGWSIVYLGSSPSTYRDAATLGTRKVSQVATGGVGMTTTFYAASMGVTRQAKVGGEYVMPEELGTQKT